MTRDDVVVDGRRLAVWTRPGERVPLLVIHGGPDVASGYLRHHLPPALPEAVPLVFVDLPGCGRSEERRDATPLTMAEDLETLVTELGLERIVPLGHSFGGLVALMLALRIPHRMRGLVLVDPDPPRRAAWQEAFAILDARRSEAERAQLASMDASGAWRSSVDGAVRYLRLRLEAYAHDASVVDSMELDLSDASLAHFGEVGARARRGAGEWDLRPSLDRVRAPALIISGPASPFPPDSLEELRDCLPGATLKILDGTGHFPFLEAPAHFREALESFLISIEA